MLIFLTFECTSAKGGIRTHVSGALVIAKGVLGVRLIRCSENQRRAEAARSCAPVRATPDGSALRRHLSSQRGLPGLRWGLGVKRVLTFSRDPGPSGLTRGPGCAYLLFAGLSNGARRVSGDCGTLRGTRGPAGPSGGCRSARGPAPEVREGTTFGLGTQACLRAG